ncbi:MAG: SGNH/GDSL hydrolase family protein [Clostridiales bacterium]|nr:SGNH/GDSL hydrolase family protein [Clostridiales bacterium]
MKKSIATLICIALLAGCASVGVYADEPMLISENPDVTEDIAPLPIAEDERTGVDISPFKLDAAVNALVLGDSNACAYGTDSFDPEATVPVDGSFASIAAAAVLRNDQSAALFAKSGATTIDVLDLFTNPEKAALTEAAVKQSEFIIINIGGNDLLAKLVEFKEKLPIVKEDEKPIITDELLAELQDAIVGIVGEDGTVTFPENIDDIDISFEISVDDVISQLSEAMAEGVEEMTANIAAIVGAIMRINPNAYICVTGIPSGNISGVAAEYGDEFVEALAEMTETVTTAANAAIKSAVDELTNVVFVDVNEAAADVETMFQADGIHFTAEAHAAIGENVGNAINEYRRIDQVKKLLFGLI